MAEHASEEATVFDEIRLWNMPVLAVNSRVYGDEGVIIRAVSLSVASSLKVAGTLSGLTRMLLLMSPAPWPFVSSLARKLTGSLTWMKVGESEVGCAGQRGQARLTKPDSNVKPAANLPERETAFLQQAA